MPRPPGHGPGYEARRQSIIDHAATLFAEQGYAATGISDICTRVGLGKGALYHYIGSKENLLVEIQNRVLEPLLIETQRIQAIHTPATVRLRIVSQHLLTVILERLDHIWVYEHDYRHLTGENRTKVLAQRREFERQVRAMLEEAMDTGAIDRSDARLATLQFLNLHNHTYQWARRSLPWTAPELSRTYYRTLMLGFGAKVNVVNDAERRLVKHIGEDVG
jgi:AcrR family transcriptional regulator